MEHARQCRDIYSRDSIHFVHLVHLVHIYYSHVEHLVSNPFPRLHPSLNALRAPGLRFHRGSDRHARRRHCLPRHHLRELYPACRLSSCSSRFSSSDSRSGRPRAGRVVPAPSSGTSSHPRHRHRIREKDQACPASAQSHPAPLCRGAHHAQSCAPRNLPYHTHRAREGEIYSDTEGNESRNLAVQHALTEKSVPRHTVQTEVTAFHAPLCPGCARGGDRLRAPVHARHPFPTRPRVHATRWRRAVSILRQT